MLLIKPEQHDSLAVECFGEVVLEHIHRSLVNHYVDSAIDVTTDTVPLMQSTLKTLQRGSVTRQQALDNVLKAILDRDMDDNDRVILDIFTNCIKNLPKRPLLNTISELELCATYIDPVLRPIFHDPDNKRIFRWFDHKTLDHERTGSSRRPDSIVCLVEQSMVTATNGFGEVKVKGSKKQDLAVDLTRLGIFAKDALDIHDLDCCICFQAFGGHLTFYLATLHADGAYVFFEVGKFEVPFSLEDVPGLIANVDAILEVRHVYKKWCNKKAAASHPANHDFSRPTLRSPHFDELVHYHPPSSRTPHYTF
ncbi:hypothetical protein DM01DRAFT_1061351 [Hesseltinella vesiculosa]|uniref:Uncharacterized protein n=1 Tax=Hesseltinella vesiculosa TaxID=101127 RepID=A0A1X2GF76_9FUNG|nr:hypothetical protein DM01DRAFT_1061351 [Hesseltinella vesiculosa]